MPSLSDEDLARLRRRPTANCHHCRHELRQNYCRQCDEFFEEGHDRGCGEIGDEQAHKGHRTY